MNTFEARLELTERIPPKEGVLSVTSRTVALITVTAASPAEAMKQIHVHAGNLRDWHISARIGDEDEKSDGLSDEERELLATEVSP